MESRASHRQPAESRSAIFLIPQPSGFEGCFNFGPAEAEHFDPDDLVVAELVRTEKAILDPGIASRHPTRKTTQGDDLVAAVEELIDLETAVGQEIPLRPYRGADFVPAAPRARFDRRRRVDELDSEIAEVEQGVHVAPVPSVQPTAHDLDVLLRHRLRSIFAGLG